jgi:osmotically-inducible protein OsmY
LRRAFAEHRSRSIEEISMFRRQTSALLLAAVLSSAVITGCAATSDRASTGQAIDDTVITAKVKAMLIEDPVTKAHQISVETFKGTVQLSGFVDSAASKSRAETVAKSVDGVSQVKNSLVVKAAG